MLQENKGISDDTESDHQNAIVYADLMQMPIPSISNLEAVSLDDVEAFLNDEREALVIEIINKKGTKHKSKKTKTFFTDKV